jgi:hypothetical protein
MALLLALAIGGCGGGGGGGGGGGNPPPAGTTGTVGVLLTDATSHQWDEAIATVTSVSLIGSGAPVVVFTGSQTLDLLELGDFSELFAVSEDVPTGTYQKIRLQLSGLVLNDYDPVTGILLDTQQAQLVGNGKLDLSPRAPFTLGDGDVLFVELDFDMDKALKTTDTGGGNVIVRPVVFVDVRADQAGGGRLARLHGEITDENFDEGEFELCQTDFASRWDGDDDEPPPFGDSHCAIVIVDVDTGIFDANGQPIEVEDLDVGDELTVVGLVHGLDSDDETEPEILFEAFMALEGPLGTFIRVRGSVASAFDPGTDRFGLDVAPNQGIDTSAPLAIQLNAASRIFDAAGEELAPEEIEVGQATMVDGVLVVGADDHLRAPLVTITGAAGDPGEDAFSAAVVSVDLDEQALVVNDGVADLCVNAADAEVFLVDDSGEGLSSEGGALADLEEGQELALFGEDDLGGCFNATTIIAEL